MLTRNEQFARKTKERIPNPDCRREGKEKGGIEERGKGEKRDMYCSREGKEKRGIYRRRRKEKVGMKKRGKGEKRAM